VATYRFFEQRITQKVSLFPVQDQERRVPMTGQTTAPDRVWSIVFFFNMSNFEQIATYLPGILLLTVAAFLRPEEVTS
jgi:hypothetical protein